MKRTVREKVFSVFNYAFLVFLAFVCLLPVWHVLMASISDPYSVAISKSFIFYPLGDVQIEAYKIIFSYKDLWNGYANTLFYVVCQCVLAVIFSSVGGYILSRKGLRYRPLLMLVIIIPMFFNGGMVPTFVVMQSLNLLDTLAIMVLPGTMNVMYFIFMRIAIQSLPYELEESARLDGASELRTMVQIILPLCKSTLAVIVLFTAVAKWNDYMSALIYLPTRKDLYPLQMHIRTILNSANSITNASQAVANANAYSQLIQYATIIVSIVPIMCIYPFVQKHFVHGIALGAVKG